VTVADYPDWGTNQDLAKQLNLIGSPQTPNDQNSIVVTGQTVNPGAGSAYSTGTLTMPFTSYGIKIAALSSVATPATPFCKVVLDWALPNNSGTYTFDHWYIPITNVSPADNNTLVTGGGLSKGGFLTATVTNLDSNPVTLDIAITSSSRNPGASKLQSVSNNISGSYTYGGFTFPTPISAPSSNELGYGNAMPLAANAVVARINALYSGPAMLSLIQSAAANLHVQLFNVLPESAVPMHINYDNASCLEVPTQEVALIRTPTVLAVTSLGAPATTVSYSLCVMEP
jgi:hypothetical protein